jgi:hypothetical protein
MGLAFYTRHKEHKQGIKNKNGKNIEKENIWIHWRNNIYKECERTNYSYI